MSRMLVICMCIVLMAVHDAAGGQEQTHVEESLGWGLQPLSRSALAERISNATIEYQAHAPIPRGAFYDVAYPTNREECDSLDGHAILLVTALAQDSTELPLAAVYLDGPKRKTKLKPLLTILTRVQDSTGIVTATFGHFREDIVLALPLDTWFGGTQLMIDFAKNRRAFRVGEHEKGTPEEVAYLSNVKSGKKLSNMRVAKSVILREFPELIDPGPELEK